MTGLRSTRLLIVALTPTVLAASGEDEQVLQVGRACVEVKEPDVCMASYGFECSRGRVPRESRQAEFLSCNLDLGDGRIPAPTDGRLQRARQRERHIW
jgi:hypothetical protein